MDIDDLKTELKFMIEMRERFARRVNATAPLERKAWVATLAHEQHHAWAEMLAWTEEMIGLIKERLRDYIG